MNDLHICFSSRWVMTLAAAAVLTLQPGCRSVQRFPGQKLALPATADGHLEDFSRKITSQLFENGMMIGLGNDEQNLYVFFTPDIRRGQRLPGRAVLTLWLDARGGKAEKLGLVHVGGTTAMTPPPGDRTETRAGEQRPLKIIERRQGRESFIAADGSSGPALRLTSDWGDFTYQLRIPFQGAGAWPGLDVKPNGVIAIGISWKIERPRAPEKESMDHPRGGPGGRGGEKPGRGGMPPDMEGGFGGAPAGAPASKRKIWIQTRVAGS
jgi:hypothetical protein